MICNFILGLFIFFFPFYFIKKRYGYGKNFIYDIIDKGEDWNYGFLDLKKISFNRILEISIMHRFKYKLKKRNWHKDIYPDPTKSFDKYELY